MGFEFRNIDDANKVLKKYIDSLKNARNEILRTLGSKWESTEKEKLVRYENEIISSIPELGKHLGISGVDQLLPSYILMLEYVVRSIESDSITKDSEHHLVFIKIADLSWNLAGLFKEQPAVEKYFNDIRNLIRNISGIILGDKYIQFNQMNVPAYHITYDFKTRDRERITNKEYIESFIIKIISALGMKILHGPNMMEGSAHNPGVTGFAVVDFSHIAIHTFVLPHNLENEVFMDIFSCKPYDKNQVKEMIIRAFNVDRNKVNYEVLSFGE
jgi:S-adenosylmethionine/arginine decarboxylase-like enzyme